MFQKHDAALHLTLSPTATILLKCSMDYWRDRVAMWILTQKQEQSRREQSSGSARAVLAFDTICWIK